MLKCFIKNWESILIRNQNFINIDYIVKYLVFWLHLVKYTYLILLNSNTVDGSHQSPVFLLLHVYSNAFNITFCYKINIKTIDQNSIMLVCYIAYKM